MEIFEGGGTLGAGPVYQLVRKCFSILMTHVTVPATCCLSALFAGREGQRSQLRPRGSWFLALSTIKKSAFIQSGWQVTGPTWPSVPRSPACCPRVPLLPPPSGAVKGGSLPSSAAPSLCALRFELPALPPPPSEVLRGRAGEGGGRGGGGGRGWLEGLRGVGKPTWLRPLCLKLFAGVGRGGSEGRALPKPQWSESG